MKKKDTNVILTANGHNQEFSFDHAERILMMPNSGWSLPDDSKFTFSKENGLEHRADTGKVTKAEKVGNDKQSDKTAELD